MIPYGIYFDFQEAYPIAGCNPYTDFVALRESAPGTTLKFSPVQQLRQLSWVDLSWLPLKRLVLSLWRAIRILIFTTLIERDAILAPVVELLSLAEGGMYTVD